MSKNYGAKVITMCMGLSLCLQAPVTALAASPEFARTTEEWAKLRDNVLEYDELEDLIHEYNPTVQNNIETYNKTMKGVDYDDYSRQYLLQAEEYDREAGDATDDVSTITAELSAAQARNKAAIDEKDGITVSWENELAEKKLVQQAQSTMNSYYQLLQQLKAAEKSRELTEANVNAIKNRQTVQMATQADVLAAQQSLEDADAQILSLTNQIETTRKKLITMTGWKQDAVPEIKAMPEVDLERLASFNPAADLAKAQENDYTLKIDTRQAANVTNGSNQKIYAQNVANDTQQIGVALNTAYQSVQQAKAAYDEAALNLEVSQRSMNKASVQYQVGSISRLEYLQAESGFVSAQTGLEVKRLALLHHENMETGGSPDAVGAFDSFDRIPCTGSGETGRHG